MNQSVDEIDTSQRTDAYADQLDTLIRLKYFVNIHTINKCIPRKKNSIADSLIINKNIV